MTERRLPTFANALKAIWLLTWKNQCTLVRLPGKIGSLLVLPALILITVVSPGKWTQRQSFFGDPAGQLTSFSRRLERQQIPVDGGKIASLSQILSEEYGRAQNSWQEVPNENPELRRQRLRDHLDACGERVDERARSLLNAQQTSEFVKWEKKNREGTLARLTAVQAPWGRTTPFYHWLMDFYFFIILPLTCVRGCGALIRDELQADTLGFLVTRPVSRAQLLIMKYIAQVGWLELLLLVETLLVFGAGAFRQVPDLGRLIPLFLAVQILAIPAWSALGALLGQATTRYMAAALVYGAVVEMGIGRIPTNINTLSLLRHLESLLSKNGSLQAVFSWDAEAPWAAVIALILAPVIFGGIAAFLFSTIEYHASAEMQK